MSEGQFGSDEAILIRLLRMCDLLGLNRISPNKLFREDSIHFGKGGRVAVPVDYVGINQGAIR